MPPSASHGIQPTDARTREMAGLHSKDVIKAGTSAIVTILACHALLFAGKLVIPPHERSDNMPASVAALIWLFLGTVFGLYFSLKATHSVVLARREGLRASSTSAKCVLVVAWILTGWYLCAMLYGFTTSEWLEWSTVIFW